MKFNNIYLIFFSLLILNSCLKSKNEVEVTKIGNLNWTTENLDTEVFLNGDSIPYVELNTDWQILTTPAYTYQYNDPEEGVTYKKLYNYYAVIDDRGLAPEGFRIPDEQDFSNLYNEICRETKECGGLLKANSDLWLGGAESNSDTLGFTALPGGFREQDGIFYGLGESAHFWSTESGSETAALMMEISGESDLLNIDFRLKGSALSVRCVEN